MDRNETILKYLQIIKTANKETIKKEAFKDLLNRLYAGNEQVIQLIDKITTGAEHTILNIPRFHKMHQGRADTFYNNIIIEFENNLKTNLNHAKEQLAGYLLGKFNSGEGYNYTLIVTDCITWKIFSPAIDQIENLENIKESDLHLEEMENASFTLSEDNTEDFYFWIDRFLFKEHLIKATLSSIEENFGHHSIFFIECFRQLMAQYQNAKKFGDVQVSYQQWNKFLSIAYGEFDASEEKFIIHSYLSIFSKLIAFAVVSDNKYVSEEEIKSIINGEIFNQYNIHNFVENDFYHWVWNERSFPTLMKVFRIISQGLSNFDFNNVNEDILKGVYQELIDLDTRHALGEYYTPDWLCEKIVNEYNFKNHDKRFKANKKITI